MKTVSARRFRALIPLVLLFLGGCAGTGPEKSDYANSSSFPLPPQIQDNVDFWRKVYAEWGRSQVAIHDDEHLSLVYEVVELPGPVLSGYTPQQKYFVRAKKAYYSDRLKTLERKLAAGRSLTRDEKRLHARVSDTAGGSALYGAHERVRSQRGLRERFHRGLEISGRYDAAFRKIFRSYGLPEDLAYLPHVESSFQLSARSSAGAAGVWQFTRGTGRLYLTVNHAVDERLDPIAAADGAARYLRDAYYKLGSWPLAVTSYNHGQGGMQKAKRAYGNDLGRIVKHYKGRYFGFASRNFYAEFLAAREVAGNPEKYFPEGIAYEKPLALDRLVLSHAMPALHVARHYGLSVYRLQDINLAWQRPALQGRANLPRGTTVWLPEGTMRRVASEPVPLPVVVARAEPAPKPVAVSKPVAPKVHVVKPNETLYRVALRYDLSVEELKALNRMKGNQDIIRPGQRLRVSG
jgi:membrane-bound lytic murein transglycosylase D